MHQVLGALAIVALANRVIGVIYRNVCPVVVCIGAWIIVPTCVRTPYAVACEAGRMSAENGGAPPCPAACACPDIRKPAYRPRMGRDVPRLPCGVCRGIRKPALPLPGRQGDLPSGGSCMLWHARRGASEPSARLAPQRVRADSGHVFRPGSKVAAWGSGTATRPAG